MHNFTLLHCIHIYMYTRGTTKRQKEQYTLFRFLFGGDKKKNSIIFFVGAVITDIKIIRRNMMHGGVFSYLQRAPTKKKTDKKK